MKTPAKNLTPNINEIEKGFYSPQPETPIWHSTFQESIWIHTLPSDRFYRGPQNSSINWELYKDKSSKAHHLSRYAYCITDEMVQELKVTALIYSYFPKLFRGAKIKNRTADPKTVAQRIAELAKIGSHIRSSESKKGIKIDSFSDITFEALKSSAPSIGGRPDHLKRALRTIATEAVQKNLPRPLQIKLVDIDSKSIYWGNQFDHQGIATLSDAQFLFLLSHCKQRIAEFKIAMEMEIHDEDIIRYADPSVVKKFANIKTPLESCLWGKAASDKNLSTKYRRDFGFTPAAVKNIYSESHKASMLIIMLLTGMRDTEFSLLKTGSLEYKDGLKYLTSKVVKQKNKSEPIDNKWLATPLVEDAYEVLLYACVKTGNNYLFSSPYKICRSREQGYSTVSQTFNRWIKKIDKHRLFSGHTFSPHQCRETLAYQLAKHKVGLPFISRQLKHFYNRFTRIPNEVTVNYGNYRKNLENTIQLKMAQARKDVLTDMYGENKNFAGGGGEAHKIRTDAWFKGAGIYGKQREQYLEKMANSNISLMPTSIGICNHNFININSNESKPPCYGDFSCDPDCDNHVISEGCASALKDRLQYAQDAARIDDEQAIVWTGLASQLGKHVSKFERQKDHD